MPVRGVPAASSTMEAGHAERQRVAAPGCFRLGLSLIALLLDSPAGTIKPRRGDALDTPGGSYGATNGRLLESGPPGVIT